MKYFTILAILLTTLIGANIKQSLANNNAYSKTSSNQYDYWSHHRYTPYLKEQSPLSLPESEYLKNLFMLAELAMKNRIDAQRFLGHGRDETVIQNYNYQYEFLLQAFDALTPPTKKAREAQNLVKVAMKEQAIFLNEWANASPNKSEQYRKTFARHKYVQSSHKKLLRAYNILMKEYPQETENNKQAFFDFLCAMDFI